MSNTKGNVIPSQPAKLDLNLLAEEIERDADCITCCRRGHVVRKALILLIDDYLDREKARAAELSRLIDFYMPKS